MNKTFSLTKGTGGFSPWLAALLGIIAIKAALSLFVSPVTFVYMYSGISYLLLLLLATGFSIRNGIDRTLGARPFWLLLAAGCGLWAFHQFLDLYYELGLHIDVPDNSIADDVLFLHLVPIFAAVATLPNLCLHEGKQHRWILNTLLILGFWAFLYGVVVAPYKYVLSSPGTFGARFDILYLIANLTLILMLGIIALRARPLWKMTYLHLLGASALYELSSTAANIAIDAGGYINGKLYGFGLTVSVCWFVWVPLSARVVPKTETSATRFVDKQDSRVSAWAMMSVIMISFPMVWELFHIDGNRSVLTLRLIVATATIVLLAGGAYLREYLDKREMAWNFNRRLIQAQEQERIRIGRELHDDISQRVAILAVQLELLKRSPGGQSDDTLNSISKIQEEATELSTSIVHLSHELHSPTLELLGLNAGIRNWCAKFSENRKVEILFESDDGVTRLPSEISLNVYRVLQEALNNAAKHSGVNRFDVRFWGTPSEIHLTVTDHGRGFDINAAMRGRGLGLKSMRERAKLINGLLTIESNPNRGTTIHVRVPFDSRSRPSQGISPA